MEKRPAYLGTRSDYFTHVHDLPPQLGGIAPMLSRMHLGHASAAKKACTCTVAWHWPLGIACYDNE